MWIANRTPRFLCAGVLLAAAGFKAYALVTDPALGTLYGSRWLQLLLIEYEVFLASWLLVGVAQHAARYLALTTFAAFGCYALYLGLSGAASCGCFGRAAVSPWWTFALDSCAVMSLAQWRPIASVWPRFLLAASAIGIPTAAGAILLAVLMESRALPTDGIIVGESYVVLEPERWVGKRLPLMDAVDIGDQLSRGSWVVLFYHHDCGACRWAAQQYNALARSARARRTSRRVAVVEMPPYGQAPAGDGAMVFGRLNDRQQWFAAAPIALDLDGGFVVRVTDAAGIRSQFEHSRVSTAGSVAQADSGIEED